MDYSKFLKRIGVTTMYENLRRIRKERGMTCEQMGKVIGIQKSTYSKKEHGKVPFTLTDAEKISNFFKIPVQQIFFGNVMS